MELSCRRSDDEICEFFVIKLWIYFKGEQHDKVDNNFITKNLQNSPS